MPLYKKTPCASGRMGLLWTLACVTDAAILEFGCMGHMLYGHKWLSYGGLTDRAELYSTHLDEKDIALGRIDRLEQAVEQIRKAKRVRGIFLLASSVPEMIGTDLRAIADTLNEEDSSGIPVITFGAGNFKATLESGIEEAFYGLVRALPEADENVDNSKKHPDINPLPDMDKGEKPVCLIMGNGCDRARFLADTKEIERILTGAYGCTTLSGPGSPCSLESLASATQADITIVLRREGIKAAKELERRYGIPYLYGAPYGLKNTLEWVSSAGEILGRKADKNFMDREIRQAKHAIDTLRIYSRLKKDKAKITVKGYPEIEDGIKAFACQEGGLAWEEGQILMSGLPDIRRDKPPYGLETVRSTLSCDINPHEPPYMGFLGTLNLCDCWLKHIRNSR